MKRTDLAQALTLAKEALANHDLLPILTHYCFDGSSVVSYNDRIGIKVDCPLPIHGAIHGARLQALINAATADEVTADVTKVDSGPKAKIKIGRGVFEFPLLEPDAFVFKFPVTDKLDSILLDEPLLRAISFCLISASQGLGRPELDGVAFCVQKGTVDLFSTDNVTIAHTTVVDKRLGKKALRLSLSRQFCDVLVRAALQKTESEDAEKPAEIKPVPLFIGESFVLAELGSMFLYGALPVLPKKPANFIEKIEEVVPAKQLTTAVDMPEDVTGLFDRTLALAPMGDRPLCQVKVAKDTLSVHMRGYGLSDEAVAIGKHEDVAIMCDPLYVRKGLTGATKILVKPSCLVLLGDNTRYYVTANYAKD